MEAKKPGVKLANEVGPSRKRKDCEQANSPVQVLAISDDDFFHY
jgi:hypothetical protein